MHKIFQYIGIASLMCFSFFVTEKTAMMAKDMDEIMIKINEESSKYEYTYKDATINGDDIIPGICGVKVNKNKSYNEMKKVGMYDVHLYQYEYYNPQINLLNSKNKYIVSGGKFKNYVYFFIELNEKNKNYIIQNEFTNYNFIVNYNFYINNLSLIEEIWQNNNSILIQNTSYRNYKKILKKYKALTNKNIFCYSNDNEAFLQTCSSNKSSTIKTINRIDSNFLFNVKKNIERGTFYNFTLNEEFISSKANIEKFISQRGLDISNIENTLIEC